VIFFLCLDEGDDNVIWFVINNIFLFCSRSQLEFCLSAVRWVSSFYLVMVFVLQNFFWY